MRRLMQEAKFAPPTFESNRKDDKFTARLLLQHFLDPADLAWLSRFEEFDLNQYQKTALVFVRETGQINNPSYRQINGVDTLPASKDLRALCLAGILEMKGKSTATYYEPGLTFQHIDKQLPTSLQGQATPLQGQATPLQEQEAPLQGQDTTALLNDKYGPLIAGVFTELDASTTSKIDKIRASVRARSNDIRDVILKLCSIRPLTTLQLSIILGRTSNLLLAHYLSPMIASGKLKYSIPEISYHPKQAYITVGSSL